MTDPQWGDETSAPKKRGIPKWVFWCGGGCLLLTILVGIVGVIFAKKGIEQVKQWTDAEAQLPELQKALPFDPLPPEMRFFIAVRFPMDWFVFRDSRGYIVNFTLARAGDGEDLRKTVLNPEFGGMGMGRRRQAVDATVEVQGRELEGLRCIQAIGASFGGTKDEVASVLLDISPEDGSHAILVQISRSSGEEPLTDDEVRLLLQPFHVGPDR